GEGGPPGLPLAPAGGARWRRPGGVRARGHEEERIARRPVTTTAPAPRRRGPRGAARRRAWPERGTDPGIESRSPRESRPGPRDRPRGRVARRGEAAGAGGES